MRFRNAISAGGQAYNNIMISIVIPAYNEEETIAETIRVLCSFFDQELSDYELVVVSDGSADRTYEIAKELENERVRIFSYSDNRGKGHALKYGFEHSHGDPVVFFDSGLNFPPQQILDFLGKLENGRQGRGFGSEASGLSSKNHQADSSDRPAPAPHRLVPGIVGSVGKVGGRVDIVIGSKRHPQSVVDYPFQRRVVSRLAQILAKLLFSLNVTDTQVGLKVFRRDVLEKAMPLVLVKRYAFDIELLALAHHFGFKIVEAPVNLKLKFSTAASPGSIYNCLMDALAVFYRLRILGFYDMSAEARKAMVSEYPVTLIDKLVCFVLGDLFGREKR